MLCPICDTVHKPVFYRGKKAIFCVKNKDVVYVILFVPSDDHDLQAAAYEAMLKGD